MGSLNPENSPKQELDDSGYVQEEAATKEAPPESTSPNLLDLSDDVLLYILQYCAPMELKALGFTCSRLGTLVLDRTLWQTVDARAEPASQRRVHWLLAHALSAHTTALRLSGYAREHPSTNTPLHTFCLYHPFPLVCSCTPQKGDQNEKTVCDAKVTLSYAALFHITQLCPSLTELILEDVLIDGRVVRISLFPKTLVKLSLRGSRSLHAEEHFLDKIYDHLVRLEELDVSQCGWVEPSCMLALSKLPRLTRLAMQRCPKLGEFTAYASLAARYGFKRLQVLDFCGSPVGDSEVSAFGWVTTLEELYLSPASNSKTDAELPVFAELLPWEEEEPEYYSSKYATEQWIEDEAHPAPLRKCSSGGCKVLQPTERVPCIFHFMAEQRIPHLDRLCPYMPTMRENMARCSNEGGSRNEHDERNGENRRVGEGSSRNGEGGSQNGEGSSRYGECSRQNEANGQNVEDTDTKQEKEQDESNIDSDKKDGSSKRKYDESNNGETKEDVDVKDKEVAMKRQKVDENNCDGAEVSCSRNQAGCSKNEASGINQSSCSTYQQIDPTKIDSFSAIRMACSNGSSTIIEVDLFKNRRTTSQSTNNNNNNDVVEIEVDLTRNVPSTSGMTVRVSQNAPNSEVQVTCSKIEASSSKDESEVTSSQSEANTSKSSDPSNDDTNEAEPSKKYKEATKNEASKTIKRSETQQVNIFKESISEFKKRLLSNNSNNVGPSNSPKAESSKKDDNSNPDSSFESDDGPQAKKPKLDKPNDTEKLDYRDPNCNDICSDTSSNCDEDDDDDDIDGIGRPRRYKLKVKSNNWTKNPEKPKDNISKEARKNLTCQMIDNIRRRYEVLRYKKQTDGGDSGAVASTSRESGSGPSNQQPDNPQQPANNNPDNQHQPANHNPDQQLLEVFPPFPHQLAVNHLCPHLQPDNQPDGLIRFRHNQPAVVVECSREGEPGPHARLNLEHILPAPNLLPPLVLPAQEVQNAAPLNRVLYVRVGRQHQAVYRANVAANYPMPNMSPAHLRYSSLVTDSAIRRFGRADGENINYVQFGPRGIVPAPDMGARPDRSNLRILSVRGFTNITDSSLDHLITAAPHLRLVDFTGTGVSEQGAMQFKCARPGCEVRCGPVFDDFGNVVRPESR